MNTKWKPPRRRRDPSCPSINQTRKSIIHQGKRDNGQDGNLLEGEEMLAVHPSIKPENQSFVKEKGNNSHMMETF